MRIAKVAVALLVAAGVTWAFQGKPINDTCPIKKGPIKPGITTTWNGKTVGFC